MSISYLNISKEELEKLYKEFGTQQKIADYLKVPVYKVKRLIGKYQLYLNKASLTKNKKAKESFIEKAQTIHNDLYEYTEVNYINSDIPVKIYCKRCQKYFEQSPNAHLSKCGCPHCQNIRNSEKQRKSLEEFIKQAKTIHGDLYDYSDFNYINTKTKSIIKCNRCGKTFLQAACKHLIGHGCPNCNSKQQHLDQRKTKEQFVKEAQIVHGDKYNYEVVQYMTGLTKIKIFCNKCKEYFYQTPVAHLQGQGCPKCRIVYQHEKQKMPKAEFIKRAEQIHLNNMYDYSEIKYQSARKKVKIKCNKCNQYFWQTPSKHLSGQGCPHCVISKGEVKIKDWLIQNKITFIKQCFFNDCKYKARLPFDFYLPDYNTCIEFQGQQHYTPVRFAKSQTLKEAEEALRINKIRDGIKKEYCKKNGIILLEIKYDENIEEKLENFFRDFKK